MSHWQMQEAKQHFSEVVRLAWKEGPQEITYRGEENAWILSARDYHKLIKKRENVVEFFQNSPCKDIDLKIERRKDSPRDISL